MYLPNFVRPIPDINGQNLYQFQTKKAQKNVTGRHIPIWPYIRKYPPPVIVHYMETPQTVHTLISARPILSGQIAHFFIRSNLLLQLCNKDYYLDLTLKERQHQKKTLKNGRRSSSHLRRLPVSHCNLSVNGICNFEWLHQSL